MTLDTTQVHVTASWMQSFVTVFLMDSPAVIAAAAFFILLIAFEGKPK